MNDASGPTIDCPWRWKINPKTPTMNPDITVIFPIFMTLYLTSIKKGKQN